MVGRAWLIFTGENPELAAKIANSLAELYLVTRFEYRLPNARRPSEWLASHMQQLRADVEQTQSKVEDYRREHSLLQGFRMTLREEEVSLERSEAEMSQRYGPLYPKMRELSSAKERFKEKVRSRSTK